MAESFFASLKGELIDTQAWPTRAAASRATVEYIAWYNGTRLHSWRARACRRSGFMICGIRRPTCCLPSTFLPAW